MRATRAQTQHQQTTNANIFRPQQQPKPQNLFRIDEKLLKEQEIMERFRIMNWNNHKFSYTPLETNHLQSMFTDEIEEFQGCIKMIKEYNKDIEKCKKELVEIKNGPFKNKFYGTLQTLCREVLFTENDRQLQKEFAKKVFIWAQEQFALNKDPRTVSIFSDLTSRDLNTSRFLYENYDYLQRLPSISRARDIRSTTNNSVNKSFSYRQDLDQTLETSRNILKDSNLPSDIIDFQLRDYEYKKRSKHQEIIPPLHRYKIHKNKTKFLRLETYKRKNLQFYEPAKILENIQKLPESKVTFPKPTGYLPNKEEEEERLLEMQDDKNKEKKEGDEGEGDDNEGQDGGDILDGLNDDGGINEGEGEQDANNKQVSKLVPDRKPFINEQIYTQEQVKQDFTRQFEQRSTFMQYISSSDPVELEMEKKWVFYRNKEIQDKRQEEELVKMMNEWSKARSKIEQEINNKSERATHGSQFEERQFKPKSYTKQQINNIVSKIRDGIIEEEDVILDEKDDATKKMENLKLRKRAGNSLHIMEDIADHKKPFQVIDHTDAPEKISDPSQNLNPLVTHKLEYGIGKRRIQNTKLLYQQLLNLNKDENDEKPQLIPSLSVYQNSIQNKLRPFSAIFDKLSPEYIQQQQLQEIEEVKNRMAKYKINVPIKKLMDSMMTPGILQGDQSKNLPEPGYGLLENPFFDAGKKKKKKKN